MLLGEKIKKHRTEMGMTQEELAADVITRNMLSSIENGRANPSLSTLKYLAATLSLPLSYLLSDDDSPAFYEKREKIDRIKKLYTTARYAECIDLILKQRECDDELSFILASAAERLGGREMFSGNLESAKKHLNLALTYAEKTVYDTRALRCSATLYLSVCNNVHSPLLEFDENHFCDLYMEAVDVEFYKYLVSDTEYSFRNEFYKKHLEARRYIKDRLYKDALSLLCEIEAGRHNRPYNAYFAFCLYTDIELCYKQLYDFENAYRYSTKRISLLESFDS